MYLTSIASLSLTSVWHDTFEWSGMFIRYMLSISCLQSTISIPGMCFFRHTENAIYMTFFYKYREVNKGTGVLQLLCIKKEKFFFSIYRI